MAMYHSWDSQNAWLRQIHSHNYLHVNPVTAQAAGIADGGWCWVESQWGKVRCMLRYSEAVEPGTVWTWNAIGKADGAWQLAPGADEARKGFLLNHLISEELPFKPAAKDCRRPDDQQLRPDHRPGRLVRRAGAHPPGGADENRRNPSRSSPPCRPRPACGPGGSGADLFRRTQDIMIGGSRTFSRRTPAIAAGAPANA
jgi:hypothetical protein